MIPTEAKREKASVVLEHLNFVPEVSLNTTTEGIQIPQLLPCFLYTKMQPWSQSNLNGKRWKISLSIQLFLSSEIPTPPLPPLGNQRNSLSHILWLSRTQGDSTVTRNGSFFSGEILKRGVTLLTLWIYSFCWLSSFWLKRSCSDPKQIPQFFLSPGTYSRREWV